MKKSNALSTMFNLRKIFQAGVGGIFVWALAGAPVHAAKSPEARPLVHPLFADHAVLQRDARVPVWGWAEPGAKIKVSFGGQEKIATAGKDGKWLARLDAMPANTNSRALKVSVVGSDRQLESSDVLVGDVWLCSGQSNMEMGMGQCNVPAEIAQANYPQLRLLLVPHKIAFTPEATPGGAWQPCSPETLTQGGWGGFSAAAYFFGRELQRELNVPIGLIESSWGGTVAEAWTSREALLPLKDFADGVAFVDEANKFTGSDKLVAALENWLQKQDPGTKNLWFKPETDVAGWKTVTLPANWNQCGLPGYEGIAWAQRTFEAPAAWAGKEVELGLGPIADVDTTWVNGVVVGRGDDFDLARKYKVPATVIKPGVNVITVRVINQGGGGFMGKPEQLQVQLAGDAASAIPLAGSWRLQDTAPRARTGPPLAGNPNLCSVLYNGMIAPLLPTAIKGAIWYQGESNADRGHQYRTLLPTLIKDWRARFNGGEFGFHIVSLANYKDVFPEPRENDWAELREAQALTAQTVPHCGLAVAIDIGDAKDIHPKNKKEVGRRLALNALALSYGKKIEWSGPWYQAMQTDGSRIRLKFAHATGGLRAQGDKLTGFAIAGADKKFVWADAVIEGDFVIVSSPAVPAPVAVRYGWDANPVCNLFNGENLPAVPFRTDDWPGTSQKSAPKPAKKKS